MCLYMSSLRVKLNIINFEAANIVSLFMYVICTNLPKPNFMVITTSYLVELLKLKLRFISLLEQQAVICRLHLHNLTPIRCLAHHLYSEVQPTNLVITNNCMVNLSYYIGYNNRFPWLSKPMFCLSSVSPAIYIVKYDQLHCLFKTTAW